ncbi:uncharacterized protein LOC126833259 [Adelges cooleyi]|uniref:uncharacterized protein LOC126833259 n=1 Tax=Adelges cooleyi TaxID=133065 RepID=UPI00217F452E|nr:uncharacterized protein LOC126833259 [Adelges cooleyi]XP_050420450.1 uncharacterized protein LOC126833259 [Adelges cooleyi]
MHTQTLISTLFWIAVFGFTSIVSDDLQRSELVNKLNMLVHHSGWRFMEDVKIIKLINHCTITTDPMSEILGAVWENRKPVDESNVLERYTEIWTVLRCKYAEVIIKYKIFLQHLIRVCRNEKKKISRQTTNSSLQRYYHCFDSVLTKLENVSPSLRNLTDAMDLINSLDPQFKPRQSINVAYDKLAEFTKTIRRDTVSKLNRQGIHENLVDLELRSITEHIREVFHNSVNTFVARYCVMPLHKEWTADNLNRDYEYKKIIQRLPQQATLLEYVMNEVDWYAGDILGSWFINLGFAYDDMRNVTIVNNSSTISDVAPIDSVD